MSSFAGQMQKPFKRETQTINGQTIILFGGRGDPWSNFAFSYPTIICPECNQTLKAFSNEHAFQCLKGTTCKDIHYIASLKSPATARNAGKKILLRNDWDSTSSTTLKVLSSDNDLLTNHLASLVWPEMKTKEWVMLQLVGLKFKHHNSDLQETNNAILVEKAPWDPYWGAGPKGTGINMLGRILMMVRDNTSLPDHTPVINV